MTKLIHCVAKEAKALSKKGGIYVIRNIVNGKLYVGSAKCFGQRWQIHSCALEKGKHHSYHLQDSWNKYGAGSFVVEVLEVVEDVEQLRKREQEWINSFGCFDRSVGYNISPSATGGLGRPASTGSMVKRNKAWSMTAETWQWLESQPNQAETLREAIALFRQSQEQPNATN